MERGVLEGWEVMVLRVVEEEGQGESLAEEVDGVQVDEEDTARRWSGSLAVGAEREKVREDAEAGRGRRGWRQWG